jgi:histone-lysine N-methyltransferase SETMAR
MILHDNARPHAAARTQALLQGFGWEVFEHPAYSPDLAASDFHLFPKLKEFLGGRRFKRDEEVKDDVKECVKWTGGAGL